MLKLLVLSWSGNNMQLASLSNDCGGMLTCFPVETAYTMQGRIWRDYDKHHVTINAVRMKK